MWIVKVIVFLIIYYCMKCVIFVIKVVVKKY